MKKRTWLQLVGLGLMAFVLFLSSNLAQKNQENRSNAASKTAAQKAAQYAALDANKTAKKAADAAIAPSDYDLTQARNAAASAAADAAAAAKAAAGQGSAALNLKAAQADATAKSAALTAANLAAKNDPSLAGAAIQAQVDADTAAAKATALAASLTVDAKSGITSVVPTQGGQPAASAEVVAAAGCKSGYYTGTYGGCFQVGTGIPNTDPKNGAVTEVKVINGQNQIVVNGVNVFTDKGAVATVAPTKAPENSSQQVIVPNNSTNLGNGGIPQAATTPAKTPATDCKSGWYGGQYGGCFQVFTGIPNSDPANGAVTEIVKNADGTTQILVNGVAMINANGTVNSIASQYGAPTKQTDAVGMLTQKLDKSGLVALCLAAQPGGEAACGAMSVADLISTYAPVYRNQATALQTSFNSSLEQKHLLTDIGYGNKTSLVNYCISKLGNAAVCNEMSVADLIKNYAPNYAESATSIQNQYLDAINQQDAVRKFSQNSDRSVLEQLCVKGGGTGCGTMTVEDLMKKYAPLWSAAADAKTIQTNFQMVTDLQNGNKSALVNNCMSQAKSADLMDRCTTIDTTTLIQTYLPAYKLDAPAMAEKYDLNASINEIQTNGSKSMALARCIKQTMGKQDSVNCNNLTVKELAMGYLGMTATAADALMADYVRSGAARAYAGGLSTDQVVAAACNGDQRCEEINSANSALNKAEISQVVQDQLSVRREAMLTVNKYIGSTLVQTGQQQLSLLYKQCQDQYGNSTNGLAPNAEDLAACYKKVDSTSYAKSTIVQEVVNSAQANQQAVNSDKIWLGSFVKALTDCTTKANSGVGNMVKNIATGGVADMVGLVGCANSAGAVADNASPKITTEIAARNIDETAALISNCQKLVSSTANSVSGNCGSHDEALATIIKATGNPNLRVIGVEVAKLNLDAEARVATTLKNLGNYDGVAAQVKAGNLTWLQAEQNLNTAKAADAAAATVVNWNNFTTGRFQRGNTELLQGEATRNAGQIVGGMQPQW